MSYQFFHIEAYSLVAKSYEREITIKKGNGEAHAWPFLHLTVLNKKKKLVKA